MGEVGRAEKGGKNDVNIVFMYKIVLKINNLN